MLVNTFSDSQASRWWQMAVKMVLMVVNKLCRKFVLSQAFGNSRMRNVVCVCLLQWENCRIYNSV